MSNNGICDSCGGYIIYDATDGDIQVWECTDCHQVLYRRIGELELHKTIAEMGLPMDYKMSSSSLNAI